MNFWKFRSELCDYYYYFAHCLEEYQSLKNSGFLTLFPFNKYFSIRVPITEVRLSDPGSLFAVNFLEWAQGLIYLYISSILCRTRQMQMVSKLWMNIKTLGTR